MKMLKMYRNGKKVNDEAYLPWRWRNEEREEDTNTHKYTQRGSRTQNSPQHKWVVLSYQVLQIHGLKTLPNTSGLSYLIRSSRFTDSKLSPTQVGCPILSGPPDSRTQNSPQHKWVVLSYQVLQIHGLKTLPNISGLSYLIRSSRFTDSKLSPT